MTISSTQPPPKEEEKCKACESIYKSLAIFTEQYGGSNNLEYSEEDSNNHPLYCRKGHLITNDGLKEWTAEKKNEQGEEKEIQNRISPPNGERSKEEESEIEEPEDSV